MIDLLIKDLDKEMTEIETEEKDSCADYNAMMRKSTEEWSLDSKSLTQNSAPTHSAASKMLPFKCTSAFSCLLLTYRSAGLRVSSKEQASLKVVQRMQEVLSENNETLAALRNILEANMIEHVKKLNNTKHISLREALHQLANVFKETMKHATQNRKVDHT